MKLRNHLPSGARSLDHADCRHSNKNNNKNTIDNNNNIINKLLTTKIRSVTIMKKIIPQLGTDVSGIQLP